MPDPRDPRVDDVFEQYLTTTGTRRVWLVELFSRELGQPRIRCLSSTNPRDEWTGRSSYVSAAWIAANLIDPTPPAPTHVDPPRGRGAQAVHIIGRSGGSQTESRITCFDDAAVMIAHLESNLEQFDSATVKWWGWEPDSTDEPPDMIGDWSEGSLKWLEGVS